MRVTPVAAERAMKLLGLAQSTIGIVTLLAPADRTKLVGMRWGGMTGEGLFGWRLFALRQVLLGAGVLAGVEPVRRANWLLQPADFVLFARAYRTRSVPRRTAVLCLGLSTTALGVLVLRATAATDSRTAT
jgi:hypothetical protein